MGDSLLNSTTRNNEQVINSALRKRSTIEKDNKKKIKFKQSNSLICVEEVDKGLIIMNDASENTNRYQNT